jgi:hypothetical protein
MRGTLAGEKLEEQKLAAFERLQPEFEASFRFIQEVHGQRRFATFPVAEIYIINHLDRVNISIATKPFEHELSEQKTRST